MHYDLSMYKGNILQIVSANRLPISASQIIKTLESKNITPNEATVFRILDTLLKDGSIRKIASRYELNNDDHHHFTCDKCGEIEDINECNVEEIVRLLSEKKHLLIKGHTLEFNGLCVQCQN